MNIPCDRRIDCPGDDSPIRNYSAEGPDSRLFCEMGFYAGIPRIGECWERTGCAQVACSLVSSEAAELEAYNASLECAISTWSTPSCPPDPVGIPPTVPPPQEPPREPVSLYRNTAQTCTVYCDSGEPVSYTVPAGTYLSRSQLEADTDAYTEACARAQELLNQSDCMGCCDQVAEILSILQGSGTGAPVFTGPNPGSGTESEGYAGQIRATGQFPMVFSISSGSLPTGLSMSSSGAITGIASVGGTYSFAVKAENSLGSAFQDFQIVIQGVLPSFFTSPIYVPYTSGYALYCSWATKTLFASTENLSATYNWVDLHTSAGYPDSYFGTPTVTWSTEPIPTQPSPTATGLPDGLSINSTTGYIEGTPTNVAQFSGANTFYFYIVATNPVGVTRVEFLLVCDP